MKKIIAMLLSLIMICSLATTAFADGDVPVDQESQPSADPTTWKSDKDVTVPLTLNKLYTVVGQMEPNENGGTAATEANLLPDETLAFVSTPDESNPDWNTEWDEAEERIANMDNLTIGTVKTLDDTTTTDKNEGMTYDTNDKAMKGTMSITLPEYDKVGVYTYVITETAGVAQAASYNINNAAIGIKVLVTYNYDAKKLDTSISLTTLAGEGVKDPDRDHADVDESEETKKWKLDTFENKYELGHLSIAKTVEGNLGDKNVEFDMTVTFTSTKNILSDITIVDSTNNSDKTVSKNWTKGTDGKYTATANIKLGDSDTVYFLNIPAGVTYTVAEAAKHTTIPEGKTLNTCAADEGYTVEYTGETGTIQKEGTSEATVTNTKETTVDTGIVLDSAPYIVMLVVAMVGVVALVSKKRYEV